MALLFVCLVLQLVLLCPSTNAAENYSCISDYDELRKALRDNDTNNIQTLLNVFYTPNRQDIQVAEIVYCVSENKTYCSTDEVFQFKWAASALLLIQEYELIDALVFDLFKFNYTTALLIISPPFCDDVNENDKLSNLQLLTTWIKHLPHSGDNNGLQNYAAYFNTTTNTIDVQLLESVLSYLFFGVAYYYVVTVKIPHQVLNIQVKVLELPQVMTLPQLLTLP
uniref:Uncharacterized protein n=1 Tax=Amphimedon queenslandica TaxID=400682 RepID=A0A1X7TYJ7_AMPQE